MAADSVDLGKLRLARPREGGELGALWPLPSVIARKRPTISQIRASEAALGKLGKRGISEEEAEQVLNNAFVLVSNLRGHAPRHQPNERRALIGRTDGGRTLTLVIEETIEPTSWLIITGWTATKRERKILDRG